MTFAEFQSTRHDATLKDLDRAGYTYCDGETPRCFVYADFLVIEDTAKWTNNPRKRYYLRFENSEYWGDALEPLERKLYNLALEGGHLEGPPIE